MAKSKRILVEVDPNQWAALKGQAQAEGRFVRVLLGEAIGLYLSRPARAAAMYEALDQLKETSEQIGALKAVTPRPPWPASQVTQPPSVKELRTLVASVPASPHETARERAERIAKTQAYYREHPEEEGQ